MSSFRVRTYANGDVRWIDLEGDAAATLTARVHNEVASAFDRGADHETAPCVYVLDLSGMAPGSGVHALDAILDAVPPATKLALIPPQDPGWCAGLGHRHAISAEVFATQQHALQALGLEGRGTPRERPDENRRHDRVSTQLRARISFEHPRGTRWGQAYIANLSRSGACLKRLDIADFNADDLRYLASGVPTVTLEIALDAGRGRVRGRVVRLNDEHGLPNLGVRFEEISPPLAVAIAHYVEERRAEALA